MFGVDDLLLGTLVGGIGSGLISTAGQIYTNKTNTQNVKNTNNTNYQIAALNNATQVDLSNTAHQREVADLEAAGLNPILSAGGNGAVTPSLQSTRMDSAQIENPTDGIANSAKSLGRYVSGMAQAELDQTKADAKYAEADTERLKRENAVDNLRAKNDMMEETVRNQALRDLTTKVYQDEDHVWHDEFDPNSDYVKQVREGYMSSAKNKANQNWRNNLDSISRGVNSASSFLPWKIKRQLKGKQ